MKKHRKSLISWMAVLLWMALIFLLSHQPAQQSDQLSSGITRFILDALDMLFPGAEGDFDGFNHLVRKNAHFFAYLVLGLLATNAVRHSGYQSYWLAGLPLLICVLYASSDEIHQLFVLGRSAQVMDVIIDSAGAGLGFLMNLLMVKASNRKTDLDGENND